METIRKNPLTDIIERVSFVNYLPLLTRATADNDEPTPGYLLQEIESITRQPDPCCHHLVDYLAQRLDRPSAPVKVKVLKIMNHLIQNGPRSFRHYLRKKDGSIKMATSFQTAPDPLTGTSGAEAVRKLSQEVLGRLFDVQLLAEDSGALGSGNSGMSGSSVGSSSSSSNSRPGPALGGLGSSGASKGRYEGFGSSSAAKKEGLVDTIRSAMDKWASSSNSTDRFIEEALRSNPGDYKPVPLSPISGAPALMVELQSCKAPEKERVHVPGRAGGGWDSPIALYTPVPPVEEPQEPEVPADTSSPADMRPALEAAVVTDFCSAGTLPCRLADIRATGQRCLELSTADVLQAISKVLSDAQTGRPSKASSEAVSDASPDADVAVIRAMLLLEWLLRSDTLACSPLPSDLCSPALEHLAEEGSKRQKAVRFKAEKLLLTMHHLQSINTQDSGPLALP